MLVTHGTRGDVQPFLALAVAFRRAGHDAVLAAPASFADSAVSYDVEFAPLDEGPNRLLRDPTMVKAIEGGYRGVRGKLTAISTIRRIKPLMADVLRDVGAVACSSGADLLVHSPSVPAQHAAELLGVPAVLATLQPGWVPTSEFPCPMVPLPRVPRFLNRATYLTVSATMRAYNGVVNTWRADDLGLARGRGPDHALVLQAFSSAVTPVDPAWPESVRTTGFWLLPRNAAWSPEMSLRAFLEAGPPPVYLGFGSMAGRDAQRIGDIVADAVRDAGVRAVVATGWGGLATRSSDDLLVIDQAPHDWLFGKVAAVVHHGGGGTTAAALAAGVAPGDLPVRRRSTPLGAADARCRRCPSATSPPEHHRHLAQRRDHSSRERSRAPATRHRPQRADPRGRRCRHSRPRPGGDPQWTWLTASRRPSA
ncbi:glycosyltransferase [Lentzea sp. NEAU-D7]|uniref:glycosyltransferase n=1 Tax=Lentzea sp. NEAU-D7 TaxID=2994667 RepID=UPI00224A93F9|nr:glycosyltransferase [Lentzea sp. NEAU-D7]MCX2948827.1 glycosyltransferase [Lentzea sp. NEAU-D7]